MSVKVAINGFGRIGVLLSDRCSARKATKSLPSTTLQILRCLLIFLSTIPRRAVTAAESAKDFTQLKPARIQSR